MKMSLKLKHMQFWLSVYYNKYNDTSDQACFLCYYSPALLVKERPNIHTSLFTCSSGPPRHTQCPSPVRHIAVL